MGLLAGVGERWRVSELVGRLSPMVLDAAMDRWRAAGASAAMVWAAHGVVRFAVSWAVEQRWLAADVLAGAGGVPGCSPRGQVPVSTVRAVVAATREDVRRAEERYVRCGGSSAVELGLFRAEQRLLLVYLVADTGLRCGELAGLRSDDLLGRELWIERAVKRDPRGGLVVGPTKSHRHSRLTVSTATAQRWHAHVHAWHSPPHARAQRSVWLFRPNPQAEQPISTGALAARFNQAKALVSCSKASLHGVRHTVATSLALAGRLAQAQDRLRHRAPGTTARHYVDYTGLDDESVADDLERVFLIGPSVD